MRKLEGRLIKLECGQVALVKRVVEKNAIPTMDWIAGGKTPPSEHDRRRWDTGADVFGTDLDLELEDGSVLVGWCADNDWRIEFYNMGLAREKFDGHYSQIFSTQAFTKEDGTPGLPVGLLLLDENGEEE